MHEVVLPMLHRDAAVLPEIILGMARRLEHAGAVCDEMLAILSSGQLPMDARIERSLRGAWAQKSA